MARFMNVVFYADDPNALATFWAAVRGYPPPDPEGFAAFVAEHGVTPEMVATDFPEYYWQMRDPEGNEFCLQ